MRGRASLPRTSVIAGAMIATLVDSLRPWVHETTICLDTRHVCRTFCVGPVGSPASTLSYASYALRMSRVCPSFLNRMLRRFPTLKAQVRNYYANMDVESEVRPLSSLTGAPMRLLASEVLRYALRGPSRDTVRRHYLQWRAGQEPPIPIRCDNAECEFHTGPLLWNGEPLGLILDHINGNSSDNNTQNLRLLCPNCDAQLPTRGGGNKGRIEKSEGGYAFVSKDGRRDYVLPAEPGSYTITGKDAGFSQTPPSTSDRR